MDIRNSNLQLTVKASAATDIGSRGENEDSYLLLYGDRAPCGTLGLFAVADGMGGSGKGGVASKITMQTLADVFPAACDVNEDARVVDARDLLRFALQKANAAIMRAAATDKGLAGTGAACVVASIADGSLHLASVGDSRAYLYRAGNLERITEDEWVREGAVTIVNQAVGLQTILSPETNVRALEPDDTILLTTDGLTEAVLDERIAELLHSKSKPADVCGALIQAALAADKPDNVTVIVVRVATRHVSHDIMSAFETK